MLPLPVAAERLQLVPGRRGHDAQFRRGMQLQQFPQRDALERAEAPGMLISEKLLGFFRREALNHTRSILRITLYVKGYDSKVGTGTALLGFELKNLQLPLLRNLQLPVHALRRRTQMRLVAGFPRCMVFPLERRVIVSSYSRFSTSTVVDGRRRSPSRNSRNCASFS